MAKSRLQKSAAHDALVAQLTRMQSVVLVGFTGLSVKDATEFRNQLRESGIEMVVVKKTILRRALKSVGIDGESALALEGELALIVGFHDEVAPAKLAAVFRKTHEALTLKGGFVRGEYLDGNAVMALAKLPGRDDLRTRAVWVLQSPVRNFVGLGAELLRSFVRVISAKAEQRAAATH